MIEVFQPHNIIPKTVNEIGEEKILNELKVIIPLLDGYNWYYSAGTALGLYRDGHLIKHDTDIDIEILINGDNIKSLNNQLSLNNLAFIRGQYDENDKYMQLCYRMKCGFIFDIYFYYREGDLWVNHNEHGKLIMKDELLNNPEKYLEFRYGKNWRIPKRSKGNWIKDAGDALLKQ